MSARLLCKRGAAPELMFHGPGSVAQWLRSRQRTQSACADQSSRMASKQKPKTNKMQCCKEHSYSFHLFKRKEKNSTENQKTNDDANEDDHPVRLNPGPEAFSFFLIIGRWRRRLGSVGVSRVISLHGHVLGEGHGRAATGQLDGVGCGASHTLQECKCERSKYKYNGKHCPAWFFCFL